MSGECDECFKTVFVTSGKSSFFEINMWNRACADQKFFSTAKYLLLFDEWITVIIQKCYCRMSMCCLREQIYDGYLNWEFLFFYVLPYGLLPLEAVVFYLCFILEDPFIVSHTCLQMFFSKLGKYYEQITLLIF